MSPPPLGLSQEFPLSPSDLEVRSLAPPSSARLFLAGRVSRADSRHITLSDAWRSVSFAFDPQPGAPRATPGDMLEVELQWRDGWRITAFLGHNVHPEPRGDGETLRLSANRAALLVARAQAQASVREYFKEQHFLEVQTPTFAVCPGLDPHVHSLSPVECGSERYHLITSPEFHMKRLLTAGLPRIFQLARCFRAEESGKYHQPEFTLLEWYRAFASWETILDDTEQVVRRVFRDLAGAQETRRLGDRPFLRLTVREAFARSTSIKDAVALAHQDPDTYFELLVDRVEPALTDLGVPVFLTHFPASQAALARLCPDDPSVAERFELYVGGVELCNGFGELTDSAEQRRRFELEQERRRAAGEPVYPLDEKFLAALTEGMPPAAGNALGVDRLVALVTESSDIASTLSFGHLER